MSLDSEKMTIKELHDKSLEYADLAYLDRFNKNYENIKFNYIKAFEYEKKAAFRALNENADNTNIYLLFKGAAFLAYLCHQYDDSLEMIDLALQHPSEIIATKPLLLLRTEIERINENH